MAEVDTLKDVLPRGVEIADHPTGPPLGTDSVWLAGMPDVHRTEVRAGRIGVTNAMDDGDLALIIEPFHWSHVGVEAQRIVNGQDLVLGDTDIWPVVPVEGVRIGNNRVEVVIGARELQDHHHRI